MRVLSPARRLSQHPFSGNPQLHALSPLARIHSTLLLHARHRMRNATSVARVRLSRRSLPACRNARVAQHDNVSSALARQGRPETEDLRCQSAVTRMTCAAVAKAIEDGPFQSFPSSASQLPALFVYGGAAAPLSQVHRMQQGPYISGLALGPFSERAGPERLLSGSPHLQTHGQADRSV